jgi:hypothetical protein
VTDDQWEALVAEFHEGHALYAHGHAGEFVVETVGQPAPLLADMPDDWSWEQAAGDVQ